MGSWNYYVEIKTDKSTLDRMASDYEQTQIYQEAFYFGKLEEDCNNQYNALIIAIIDNFLPTNHLIYYFLSSYISCELYIRSNGVECIYDFSQKSDFIKYMYDVWESKLDHVYDKLGVVMIKYKQYHRSRNKLYKKYYMRIPSVKS